jgi:hypothetical protein
MLFLILLLLAPFIYLQSNDDCHDVVAIAWVETGWDFLSKMTHFLHALLKSYHAGSWEDSALHVSYRAGSWEDSALHVRFYVRVIRSFSLPLPEISPLAIISLISNLVDCCVVFLTASLLPAFR